MWAYVIMNSSIGVRSPNPNLPHENLAIHPSPAPFEIALAYGPEGIALMEESPLARHSAKKHIKGLT